MEFSSRRIFCLFVVNLYRRRPGQKLGPTSVLQGLIEDNEEKGKPPHVILIGQLFSFIGSEPQKAVSTMFTSQDMWVLLRG